MKLVGCNIEFEHRYELEMFQEMIEIYLKNKKDFPYQSDREELKKLKNNLEGLWYCW